MTRRIRCFTDTAEQLNIFIHNSCDIILMICTLSNQTKSTHGEEKEAKVPSLAEELLETESF